MANPSISAGSVASLSLSVVKYAGGIDIGSLGTSANITISGRGSYEFTDASVTTNTAIVSGHMRKIGTTPTGMTLTYDARWEIDRDMVPTDVVSAGAITTSSGVAEANMVSLNGNTTSASNLQKSTSTIETGTAITGTLTTTQATTDLAETTDDHYQNRLLLWVTGNLAKQGTPITAYNGITKILTYVALTEAPANTDEFVIV